MKSPIWGNPGERNELTTIPIFSFWGYFKFHVIPELIHQDMIPGTQMTLALIGKKDLVLEGVQPPK